MICEFCGDIAQVKMNGGWLCARHVQELAEDCDMPNLQAEIERRAALEIQRLQQEHQNAETMFTAIASMPPMRQANIVRRVQAWLDAPSGSLDKGEIAERLRMDAIHPWTMPKTKAQDVIKRLEAITRSDK